MSDFSIDHRTLPAISPEEEAEFLGATQVDEEAVKTAELEADSETLADEPEDPDAVPDVSDDPYDLDDELLSLIEDIDPDDIEDFDDDEDEAGGAQ